jgi:hypothetical protein
MATWEKLRGELRRFWPAPFDLLLHNLRPCVYVYYAITMDRDSCRVGPGRGLRNEWISGDGALSGCGKHS